MDDNSYEKIISQIKDKIKVLIKLKIPARL